MTKSCIVITSTELGNIIGELTGYIPCIVKDEDDSIYVDEVCDMDLNVCDVDINVYAAIESYFGIVVKSIHGSYNEEKGDLDIRIEY